MSLAVADWVQVGRSHQYLSADNLEVLNVDNESATKTRPQWPDKVVSRLAELLCLKANWDSYGALKPRFTSALAMLGVLSSVMTNRTPAPSIVPSSHGHFQAEWHRNGVDLEVEVVAPTKISVSFSDRFDSTLDWDEELDVDFTRLVEAVRRVGLV